MRIPVVQIRFFVRPIGVPLLAVLFAHLVSGCSGKKPSAEPASLTWPELDRLEAALIESSELIEAGRTTELLLRRRQLLEVGWAVNLKTLPPESGNVETLRQLLGDLVSKVNRLASPEIDTSTMREVISGMKPIVAEIGRVSGTNGI